MYCAVLPEPPSYGLSYHQRSSPTLEKYAMPTRNASQLADHVTQACASCPDLLPLPAFPSCATPSVLCASEGEREEKRGPLLPLTHCFILGDQQRGSCSVLSNYIPETGPLCPCVSHGTGSPAISGTASQWGSVVVGPLLRWISVWCSPIAAPGTERLVFGAPIAPSRF